VVFISSTVLQCTVPIGEGSLSVVVKSSPALTSGIPFSYDDPIIERLESVPSGGYATSGGQAVVIIGRNFGSVLGYVDPTTNLGARVQIGGSACSNLIVTSFTSYEAINCSMPSGTGNSSSLQLTVAGRVRNWPTPLRYARPTLSYIATQLGQITGGQTVVLAGTGYVDSSSNEGECFASLFSNNGLYQNCANVPQIWP
jgi:hypothetical protein